MDLITIAIDKIKDDLKKEAAKQGDGKYVIPAEFMISLSMEKVEDLRDYIKGLKPSVIQLDSISNEMVIYF